MIKKIFGVLFLVLLFSGLSFVFTETNDSFVRADEELISVYFFYSRTCPHCGQEKVFLENLEKKYIEIEIKKFDTFEKDNIKLLKEMYENYQVAPEERGYIPITFIKERYFLGFQDQDISGKEIENYIISLINEKSQVLPVEPSDLKEKTITIPFFGEIRMPNSPLLLSVVLGFLDGFNACAMVALGFLLAVLIGTGKREKIFFIGGTFILVSGIVYFLFISAWLNLFLCLTHQKFITFLMGLVIVLFALFLLKDFFQKKICRICDVGQEKVNILTRFQRRLFEKMRKFSDGQMSLHLSLLGIAVVAVGVNMVELCCSFGFPLIFTKILSSWNLPIVSYYFYLLVYIIFYLLDDFLIFSFAVFTLKITRASDRYLRAIKLISGILLLILGLLMLIRPEILMLGSL